MTAAPELGQLQLLDLSKVEIHESNPRRDVGDLTELAASIKSAGVLEPIVVVKRNGHFAAVTGSRRTAASRLAGMTQIPARVMEMDEAQVAAAALIENLQRKDLAPLEEAEAFQKYLQLTGVTQVQLGKAVGRAPSTIANALRLLDAPKPVKAALADGRITAAHARVVLELKDPSEITRLPLKQGVTVHELKERVDDINADYETSGPPAIERVKAFFERAKKDNPKYVITWTDEPRYRGDGPSLTKALGDPPKKIVGRLYRPEKHDGKGGCACRVYQIAALDDYSYDGSPVKYHLERVCVDRAGFKKAEGHLPYNAPKGTTKAERDAQMAKDAAEHVASAHRWHGYSKREQAVHAKLVKHKDVERLVLMALADWMSAPSYTYHSWQAIAKLSSAQVRERLRLLGTQKVIRGAGSYGSKKVDRGMEAVLGHFKVDPKDLGYEVKESKKKAKRA
jgi:ParB family chromosome partitioning protein